MLRFVALPEEDRSNPWYITRIYFFYAQERATVAKAQYSVQWFGGGAFH